MTRAWARTQKQTGFTIVELLIVIIIIAILAAITIVAYNGIQQRAYDSDRTSGIATIQKALELYYIKNGEYPTSSGCGSSTINTAWCTTADDSWETFETRLTNEFISTVPSDPISTPGGSAISGAGYNYAYFSYPYERCGAPGGQWYLLAYVRASGDQIDDVGACSSGTPLSAYANASVRIVVK